MCFSLVCICVEINFLTPSTKGKRCWRKIEKILVVCVDVNNYAIEILINENKGNVGIKPWIKARRQPGTFSVLLNENKVYGLYFVKLLSTTCLLLIFPMTKDRESAKLIIGKSNFRNNGEFGSRHNFITKNMHLRACAREFKVSSSKYTFVKLDNFLLCLKEE